MASDTVYCTEWSGMFFFFLVSFLIKSQFTFIFNITFLHLFVFYFVWLKNGNNILDGLGLIWNLLRFCLRCKTLACLVNNQVPFQNRERFFELAKLDLQLAHRA